MTEVRDAVIDEVTHRSRNLSTPESVELIERHHRNELPGIDRGTLAAYAEALADEPNFEFDPDEFETRVDERLVGGETWVDDEALYDLGNDRISAYPRAWHDRLGGETDVREYVAYLQSDASGFAESDPYDEQGVPESTLLDVVPVVGRTDRDAVKAQIEDRRAAGEISQGADQHPNVRVRLESSDA